MSSHAKTSNRTEESYLDSKRKGRPARIQRILRGVTTQSTAAFFQKLLTDETEHQLWMIFMTGKAPVLDAQGKPTIGPDGKMVLEDVELNPISFNAFKLAVQYKRGMPVVKLENKDGEALRVVEVVTIGANPNYFKEQAEARGLLTVKV